MTTFKYKTVRCEWEVVIQNIDQYGMSMKDREVVSVWGTFEEAATDLPLHGVKPPYSPRWLPHNAVHSYQILEVPKESFYDKKDI